MTTPEQREELWNEHEKTKQLKTTLAGVESYRAELAAELKKVKGRESWLLAWANKEHKCFSDEPECEFCVWRKENT